MIDPKITFGEFVALAKSRGVKDDTEIDLVDFAGADEIRFTIYDGQRVTIIGMVDWDNWEPDGPEEPEPKPKKG